MSVKTSKNKRQMHDGHWLVSFSAGENPTKSRKRKYCIVMEVRVDDDEEESQYDQPFFWVFARNAEDALGLAERQRMYLEGLDRTSATILEVHNENGHTCWHYEWGEGSKRRRPVDYRYY
mgnify:CR=1 FL=1|tara:strand:+ start:2957 stop:3316 length:360 start_codon:yes stop_codon:yes gene_type:complete